MNFVPDRPACSRMKVLRVTSAGRVLRFTEVGIFFCQNVYNLDKLNLPVKGFWFIFSLIDIFDAELNTELHRRIKKIQTANCLKFYAYVKLFILEY